MLVPRLNIEILNFFYLLKNEVVHSYFTSLLIQSTLNK